MRAVMIHEELLEERRRYGQDKRDEVWDGVLHIVPTGTNLHGRVALSLIKKLQPIAERRGLEAVDSQFGMYEPGNEDNNYRVPDVSIIRPEHNTERGLCGAAVVIEVLSPRDESRKKLPFYAKQGVEEVWLVAPKIRTIELYRLSNTNYALVRSVHKVFRSPILQIDIATVQTTDGPRLRLTDGDYVADA